ncbi:MAG: tetratricopeptide repeat protein [Candidatus Aminicenantes bacterium]
MKKSISIIFCIALFFFSADRLTAQTNETPEILENNIESVIAFTAYDDDGEVLFKGTGFMLDDRVMVTNYHLLSQAEDAEGVDYRGKKVRIDGIIDVNEKWDLAVVRVRSRNEPVKLGGLNDIEFGSQLYIIGSNEVGEMQGFEGKITNIQEVMDDVIVADTSISTVKECSGAPVFDENGMVVGVLVYPDRTSKFIIPAEMLRGMKTDDRDYTRLKRMDKVEYFATVEGMELAGRAFTALDNTAPAEGFLEKLIEEKPGDIELKQMLAEVYTEQRDYNSAVSVYNKIIELDPDRASAYLELGDVYVNMRKWDEAIPVLEKAVELNPQKTRSYYFIGRAYEEQEDFANAVDAFSKFVESNPENPEDVHQRMGFAQMEIEDYEGAIESLGKAVEKDPGDTRLKAKLAEAHRAAEQYEEAEKIYEGLAEANPDEARVYYNTIIQMYDNAGMPDNAIDAAKKIVELDPENADAVYNLGYMYVKEERFQEAVETFNRAIEIRPSFEYAYMNLGFSYSQLNQYGNAIQAFQELVKLNPDNDNAWFNIAVNYMQQKKWSSAVEPLRKVIELRPDYPLAYYNLGIVYLNMGDNPSARQAYLKLKELDPNMAQRLLKYFR